MRVAPTDRFFLPTCIKCRMFASVAGEWAAFSHGLAGGPVCAHSGLVAAVITG
jgi:hypothetical protein